ncbi:MAG: DMT family transporter [Desulfobacula sp.]|nr:DMT family transporter [Desulfobacula sp.]
MKKKRLRISKMALAYSGLSLAVFFWAINTVIAKAVIFQIKPMTLSFYRWVVAFVIIMPFAIPHLKKDEKLIKQHLGFLFILAVPSVAADYDHPFFLDNEQGKTLFFTGFGCYDFSFRDAADRNQGIMAAFVHALF